MLVIHGTYSSEKQRGIVVDQCAHCNAPTIHRITQHFRTPHLYFVPLGAQLFATTIGCIECGAKKSCPKKRYARTLAELEARSMRVGEILLKTNPELAKTIEYRTQLNEQAHVLAGRGDESADPRVQLAFRRMAALDCDDQRAVELIEDLCRWPALDDLAQAQLLDEVEALVAKVDQERAGAQIVALLAERLKPEPDAFPEFAAFLIVLGVGTALTMQFLRGSTTGIVIGMVLSFAATIGATVWVHKRMRQWTIRRFFHKVLLPEANSRGISIASIGRALGEIDVTEKGIDPRLARMAEALPMLLQLLVEKSRNLDQQNQRD